MMDNTVVVIPRREHVFGVPLRLMILTFIMHTYGKQTKQ